MKIKVHELWQKLGVEIHINADMADEHMPEGFYYVIEKEHDNTYMFLDSKKTNLFYLEEWDETSEVSIVNAEIEDRVQALVDGLSIRMIGLIADGWTENNNGHFDLTSYNTTLKEYKKLLDIIKDEE